MSLQGVTVTHPLLSLAAFISLYFKCWFCEAADTAAQSRNLLCCKGVGCYKCRHLAEERSCQAFHG